MFCTICVKAREGFSQDYVVVNIMIDDAMLENDYVILFFL